MKAIPLKNLFATIIIGLLIITNAQSQYLSADSNVVIQVSNAEISTPDTGLSIPSGGYCVLQSATKIDIKSGFHAYRGSYFHAFIAPVNPSSDLRTIDSSQHTNSTQSELSKSPLFNLYPNPTSGIVHLIISGNTLTETDIYIYDIIGKPFFQSVNNSNQLFTFDISDAAKGVYIIKVLQGGNMETQKIVLQ